jgi:hypothetical protein
MALPPQKPGSGSRLGQKGAPQAGPDPERRAESERHATEELADQCQRLEEELEELKAKYEMYFLGVDRLEPVRRREETKRNIARLKSAFTRNTGLRFRIQTLHARYLSYERMWLRAARQKEDGTYGRDLFKARRRAAGEPPSRGKRDEKKPAPAEDVDLSDWGAPATDSAARAPSAAPKPPPLGKAPVPPPAPARPSAAAQPDTPRAPGTFGLTAVQMRSLYDAYISAKKRCNEDVSKLTYEAVSRSVSKQVPDILSRYKAKAVDFKVVIKDGKAILKAVPKT